MERNHPKSSHSQLFKLDFVKNEQVFVLLISNIHNCALVVTELNSYRRAKHEFNWVKRFSNCKAPMKY